MDGVDPGWKVPAELMGKTAYHQLDDFSDLEAFLLDRKKIALDVPN